MSHIIFENFAFTPANTQITLKMSRTFLNLVLGELEFVSNLGISSLGFIKCGYTFRHQTLKKERLKKPLLPSDQKTFTTNQP